MKNYKNLAIYDFSDYAEEITGDALFKVNGGAQVANTNQGVANAKVGDTVTRNDGTTVTITQGDINWAQQQIDSSASSGNNAQQQGPGSSGSGNGPGGATETEKKEETPAVQAQKNWTYNPNEPDSDKRFNAKDFNGLHIMTIGCDDIQYINDFKSYYTTIGQYGAAGTIVYDGIGLTDKNGNVIYLWREENDYEQLKIINDVLGKNGTDIWKSTPKNKLSVDGRSGSFPIIGLCYDEKLMKNPLSDVNTLVHEVYHQVQYNNNITSFPNLIKEYFINEKKSVFDNIYDYTYSYDKEDLTKYKTISDLPFLESQAQFVGDFAGKYYKGRYGVGINSDDTNQLLQMCEIMRNSGYGDTEAVKWIEKK